MGAKIIDLYIRPYEETGEDIIINSDSISDMVSIKSTRFGDVVSMELHQFELIYDVLKDRKLI